MGNAPTTTHCTTGFHSPNNPHHLDDDIVI
jgi:hypothetical protein